MRVRLALMGAAMALPLFASGATPSQESPRPYVFLTTALFVAKVDGANEFRAYSKTVGKWNSFTFPDDVTAVPVANGAGGCCAFQVEGAAVTELVAIDLQGKWCNTRIPATAMKCDPLVTDKAAMFLVDGIAYGFSAESGEWDSVSASGVPGVSKDMAWVASPESVAVFSAATGKWAVTSLVKEREGHRGTTGPGVGAESR